MKAVPFKHSSKVGVVCLMLFMLSLMAACGTGSASNPTAESETAAAPEIAGTTEAITVPETNGTAEAAGAKEGFVEKKAVSTERTQESALEGCPGADLPPTRDTLSYARDYGVSEEVADRRMDLQSCLSDDIHALERKLKRNEGDSFAGLWKAHEPEYRFVFLFTENGQQRIQPYIEDEPYAPLVEVRSGAEATLAELISAQREAGRILDRLNYLADTSLDVKKNRAEVFVTNRSKLKDELRRTGLQLPEHVALIEVEGLSRPSVPE